jgi:xylulokinase
MRSILELNEDIYPEVKGSCNIAGTLTAEIARHFSMRSDVAVLTGTGDNPAIAVLTGCLGQGHPVISFGTSGILMLKRTMFEQNKKGKVILFSPNGQDFSYLVQGSLQSNGSAFDWWNRLILGIDDFSQIDTLLQDRTMPNRDLFFFPHLAGEKTIFSDPHIRGAFIGLDTLLTREDMIYAVIEGNCYGFRDLADNMGLDLKNCISIKVVGGGSNSTAQAQILANVLNVTVEQLDDIASPAYGIALLSACCQGSIQRFDQIIQNMNRLKVKNTFLPQAEIVAICNEKYTRYQKIYHSLKAIYK